MIVICVFVWEDGDQGPAHLCLPYLPSLPEPKLHIVSVPWLPLTMGCVTCVCVARQAGEAWGVAASYIPSIYVLPKPGTCQ